MTQLVESKGQRRRNEKQVPRDAKAFLNKLDGQSALALPEFPFKKVIVSITFGVILLSLLVQTWLLSYYSKKAHV